MHIIKSIKIRKFRSIFNQEVNLEDLAIFSGKNNVGKSNVLKALNLFFNEESGFNQGYDHTKDYNKAYTGAAGGKREIEITLSFHGQGHSALESNFYISRKFSAFDKIGEYKYHSDDAEVQKNIDKGNGQITRQFTFFLNKLEYIYVPVVRDKNFIKELFAFFEKLLEDKAGEKFRQNLEGLSEVLSEKSSGISSDFKSFLNLRTQTTLSTSINEILSAIVVEVDSGIKIQKTRLKKGQPKTGRNHPVFVDLFSSGDGVLMSYVPHFLSHICKKINGKNFIWGFEEPENSLEFSRTEDLADKFHNDFSSSSGSQILLTTHSPAFIQLKDKENVSLYRVYSKPDDLTKASEIKKIKEIQKELFNNPHLSFLEEELGFIEMSKKLEIAFQKWRERRLEEKESVEVLTQTLKDLFPEKVFICEDEKMVAFWECILLSLGIKVFSSNGVDSNIVEIALLHKIRENTDYKPIIFRQVDRDGLTDAQVSTLEKTKQEKYSKNFKKYKVMVLPVNEIENFALITEENITEFKGIIEDSKIIEDKTRETMGARVRIVNDMFGRKDVNFHDENKPDSYDKVITNMLKDARTNPLHFFKGKEISKLKQNFQEIEYLKQLDQEKYPQEFKDYVKQVQDFFRN